MMELNKIHQGDCLNIMKNFEDNVIDAIVTDPPYGLRFMNKVWDYDVPAVTLFQELLRVAKPGAILLCFGGTRTWHRIAVNIEDAGWKIRDTIIWLYGSGFPKGLDISKAIDQKQGATREIISYQDGTGGENLNKLTRPDGHDSETAKGCGAYGQGAKQKTIQIPVTKAATPEAEQWQGWRTALKPAFEPVIFAMKPLDGTFAANALKWGVAGLNVDACRIPMDEEMKKWNRGGKMGEVYQWSNTERKKGVWQQNGAGRFPTNVLFTHHAECQPGTCHSDCPVRILDQQVGIKKSGKMKQNIAGGQFNVYGKHYPREEETIGDEGSVSRFFYCGKASPSERTCAGQVENNHPTVKPLDLMRYLCRLTCTPGGGVVLDPFMGTGTTCIAAYLENRDYVGIERDQATFEIAKKRIELETKQLRIIESERK